MQTPQRADLLPLLAKPDNARFEDVASAVLTYQTAHNPLLARYLDLIGDERKRTPFLPISFFKTEEVKTGTWVPETIFTSSGTTGQQPSRHLVRSLDLYLENARQGFRQFFGDPEEWAILALLPSYVERGGSSLVAMADYFIRCSQHPESGFYLQDAEKLAAALRACQSKACKTLLLGVSFALLDFAEQHPMNLQGVTVMETGGMKGRRQEITRNTLHESLRAAFSVDQIYSEYGMTELFSQAYALGSERFMPASTMRVYTTELNDPFCLLPSGKTGVLNLVDLANLDSCSFVRTEDLGRVYPDGSFEVIGRADDAELRGCNLMVE